MAFLRSVTVIGLFTLLSRLFGFIRDLMIATFLGAGPVADAFVVAQRLPNTFRSMFAEGAMDTAFVPIYSRKRQQGKRESMEDFINHVFTILLVILLPLTGLALLFMPHIVPLLAPGFTDDPQRFPLAVSYSNITVSYLLLISLTSLQGGLLNANGHFAPYASAPSILNVIMILGFIVAALFKLDPGWIGSWALIVGGIVQFLVLFIACHRYGLSVRLSRPKLTADVKQFFRLVGPGVIGTGADQLNIMIMTIMASTLPSGAVAALYYAERLNQLPLGVIGGAVATALLPALTRHITAKEEKSTIHYFSHAVEITLLLCLPACVILLLAPLPIVQILFQHGVFNANDTQVTVETITGYALTIPATVLTRIFNVRFFAHENTRTPVMVSVISIAINTGLAYWMKSFWGNFGIALAYTITMWMSSLMLWGMLKVFGYARFEKSTWRKLPRIFAAAVIMGVVMYFTDHPCEVVTSWLLPDGFAHKAIALALRILTGAAAYAGALGASGAVRPSDLRAVFKKA